MIQTPLSCIEWTRIDQHGDGGSHLSLLPLTRCAERAVAALQGDYRGKREIVKDADPTGEVQSWGNAYRI